MKIESVISAKRPAYAAGAAVLAAAVMSCCATGCGVKLAGDTTAFEDDYIETTTTTESAVTTETLLTDTNDPSDLLDNPGVFDPSDPADPADPGDTTDPYSDMTFKDIGEMYFKQPSKDDIEETDGIRYVKNQLLLSCRIGTSKETIEELCEEINAEIVGYIELTSDFQIEFKEDKTLDDLDEIADYIYGYPYISNITLNTVSDITYDG